VTDSIYSMRSLILSQCMQRFESGSDMCGFRSLNNSASKIWMEPVKLTVWKVMMERITVVKFRMDNGGGNGAGCFEVKIWADTVHEFDK